MNKFKSILLLLIVAAASFFCGVVATRIVVRQVVRTALQEPERAWTRVENRLAAKLDLTAEQRVRVDAIFGEARREIRQARAEIQPRYAATLRKFHADLAAVLNPKQREELEKLRARRPRLFFSEETER